MKRLKLQATEFALLDPVTYGLSHAVISAKSDPKYKAILKSHITESLAFIENRAGENFVKAGFEVPSPPFPLDDFQREIMQRVMFSVPEHVPRRSKREGKLAERELHRFPDSEKFPWINDEVLVASWLQLVACHSVRSVITNSGASTYQSVYAGMALGQAESQYEIVFGVDGQRIRSSVIFAEGMSRAGRAGQQRIPRRDNSQLIRRARALLASGTHPRELVRAAINSGVSKLSERQTRTILQRAGLLRASAR